MTVPLLYHRLGLNTVAQPLGTGIAALSVIKMVILATPL